MPVHFIELTAEHGKPMLLCINHILYFASYAGEDLLRIELVSGGFVEVQESYEVVREKINALPFDLYVHRGPMIRKER